MCVPSFRLLQVTESDADYGIEVFLSYSSDISIRNDSFSAMDYTGHHMYHVPMQPPPGSWHLGDPPTSHLTHTVHTPYAIGKQNDAITAGGVTADDEEKDPAPLFPASIPPKIRKQLRLESADPTLVANASRQLSPMYKSREEMIEAAREAIKDAPPLDFVWHTPPPKDARPLQGNAKQNATVLLTGSAYNISVNSLLREDNHIFEQMIPPEVIARELELGHPNKILIRAVLLALVKGIPDEELAGDFGLPQLVRMRHGQMLEKATTEMLFPRRKKGTTKYELCPELDRLFRVKKLPWPGLVMSDQVAEYLREKYEAKRGISKVGSGMPF